MIISDRHRYVFVELPLTASTAIASELKAHYAGEEVLFKHATYRDFLKVATPEQRGYFVFSGIRNPLDQTVSHYYKYKNNQGNRFGALPKKKAGRLRRPLHRLLHRKRMRFIRQNEAGFGAFFQQFYRWPYSNWSVLAHRKFNFLIRFESLQDDFREALQRMDIAPVRELPQQNRTVEKSDGFEGHYDTERLQQRAMRIFGPFMRYWDYAWPEGWPESREPWYNNGLYRVLNLFRKFYWKYLR
ncbi:MAG: sulfotransferase family 2 domain-containing protein [Bacteroidota bacterium]